MWRTSKGDRVLKGKEREAFLYGLYRLFSQFDVNLGYLKSTKQLTKKIKMEMVALFQVAKALFDEHVPCPRLNCWHEKTVCSVFYALKDAVNEEIDKKICFYRKAVASACRECFGRNEVPSPTCCDKDEWDVCIESLADGILWDRDFEFGPFTKGHSVYENLTISDDYYLGQCRFTNADYDQALAHLKDITRTISEKRQRVVL